MECEGRDEMPRSTVVDVVIDQLDSYISPDLREWWTKSSNYKTGMKNFYSVLEALILPCFPYGRYGF